jgi:hypothetical protein
LPVERTLTKQMLHFWKQVELAFAHESNQLDSIMCHKKVPLRTTNKVQSFFIMRDTFRLIERIVKHARLTILPKDYFEKIQVLQKIQVEQLSLTLAG